MYTVTEWGVSNEPADIFARRNMKPAKPKYPQDYNTAQEVRFSDMPFLPIVGFENADWNKMYHEAQSLEKHYVPHRHHESHKGWSSLCIHGLSSVHTEAHHTYGYKSREEAPYRWTDIADHCPTITDFFMNQFDYTRYDRIRIMKLAPGGYIIPHRDSTTLDENHIGPTNIALNNPPECHFYMDNIGFLPWEQGSVIKLNLYNIHCVYNWSSEDRYHIIAHGRAGETWDNRILDSYNYWRKIYD
ncbi:hypothetical protein EB151_00300 [archaeon]|jgi:hypothetical protein|nr:hypothetical protein [archaeon]